MTAHSKSSTAAPDRDYGRRRLGWGALIGSIVAFILGAQLVAVFVVSGDGADSSYATVRSAMRSEVVPDLLGALFAIALIVVLGWTHVVRRESIRTRWWLLIVPASMLGASIAFVDFGHLADVDSSLVMALALGTLTTGLSEELMFRGVTLQAMRDKYPEQRAAIATALLFGSAHLINVIVVGGAAIFQAIIATALGYMLYLCRRVSGGLVLPIVVHWVWDFSTYSSEVGVDDVDGSDTTFYLFLLTLGLVAVIIIGRRHIDRAVVAAS